MSELTELHLKYRPQAFKEICGESQSRVAFSIRAALKEGKSRAFLLTGPSGVGKTTLARIISNYLETDAQNYIEVDAATRTGVDSVRDLQECTRYAVIGGGNRVITVDECHMLTKGAWNALLKVIEEPPPGIYWVLCTTEPGKVPATIKSRCLSYDLGEVEEEAIFGLLKSIVKAEGFDTSEDILDVCVARSGGSPRLAITSLAAVSHCKTRKQAAVILKEPGESKEIIDLCRALIKGEPWSKIMKLLAALQGVNAESVRIVVCAYFENVARGKREPDALALDVLAAFGTPYPPTTGLYPVVLSIAEILTNEE